MFKPIEQVKAEQEYEMLVENNIGLTKGNLSKYTIEELKSEIKRRRAVKPKIEWKKVHWYVHDTQDLMDFDEKESGFLKDLCMDDIDGYNNLNEYLTEKYGWADYDAPKGERDYCYDKNEIKGKMYKVSYKRKMRMNDHEYFEEELTSFTIYKIKE